MVATSTEAAMTCRYSAVMKVMNFTPLNSVWKPATISDSPSATSKGLRLASANIETRKSRKPTGWTTMPQVWAACHSTTWVRLRLPTSISMPITDSPMETSYEIIMAEARMPPSSEYFEFDAHEPSTTP